MKKKIVFLINHLQYSDGVAKVLMDLCNNLDCSKFEITVMPLYKCDSDFIKGFPDNICIKKAFGFYFKGMSKLVSKIPVKYLYHKLINKQYDIEVAFQCGLATRLVCNSQNPKAVHVAWMHGYLNYPNDYSKLDRVVCVSKYNADKCKQECKGNVNVTYCYNLSDDELIKKLGTEDAEIIQKKPFIISVGRFSSEKGYVRLVNIMSNLRDEGYDFGMMLIGDGPEMEKIQIAIKSNHLENNIWLTGSQTNPHKFTSKADAFICSSFSEGYSTACTEAAILGVPIITTEVPGAREIINDCECGVVSDIDDESLKKTIRIILDNPDVIKTWKKKLSDTSYKFGMEYRKQGITLLFNEFYNLKK